MGTTEITSKITFGKTLVIAGDDWQVRIFSSASQPRHPERTYHVLYEDAHGEQSLEILTEAELDERLIRGQFSYKSVEEILRSANLDRSMTEYSFPATPPVEMKDI